MLYPIVTSLGGFNITTRVNASTTHLVTGNPSRRTVNLLLACMRAASILSADWVYQSLQEGQWLPVQQFLIDPTFCPAITVRECAKPLLFLPVKRVGFISHLLFPLMIFYFFFFFFFFFYDREASCDVK